MKKLIIAVLTLVLSIACALCLKPSKAIGSNEMIDENCYVKASSFQLRMTQLIHSDPHGSEIIYEWGAAPPHYLQVSGNDWTRHWRKAGFQLLEADDKIFRINGCKAGSLVKAIPGGKTLAPFLEQGYISLFDIVLVGPREEIVKQISEIEIERNGKRMILRPSEAIYREIPK